MPTGISKINCEFVITNFENYDEPPENLILKIPMHDSNYTKIESEVYNLSEDIEFSWRETWTYNDPPYLYISSKSISRKGDSEIVEYLQNATIENVVKKLTEYNDITTLELLRKRIDYLENTIDKDKISSNIKYNELEKLKTKKDTEFNMLQKNYKDLLDILKSK